MAKMECDQITECSNSVSNKAKIDSNFEDVISFLTEFPYKLEYVLWKQWFIIIIYYTTTIVFLSLYFVSRDFFFIFYDDILRCLISINYIFHKFTFVELYIIRLNRLVSCSVLGICKSSAKSTNIPVPNICNAYILCPFHKWVKSNLVFIENLIQLWLYNSWRLVYAFQIKLEHNSELLRIVCNLF